MISQLIYDEEDFELMLSEATIQDRTELVMIDDSEKSLWANIAKRLVKHLPGKHDQNRHGGNRSAGVPASVDLEGKRFNNETLKDFRSKLTAYEDGLKSEIDKIADEIANDRFGKPVAELTDSEQSTVFGSRLRDGEWVSTGGSDFYDLQDIRTAAKSNQKIQDLRAEAENHYLVKDALGQLAWNEDGTLGPRTINEAYQGDGRLAFENVADQLRFSNSDFRNTDKADYSKRKSVVKRDEQGNALRDKDTRRTIYENVLTSKDIAERIHAEEWQAFGEAAYPEVIVSNKALRSILASGEFKTYTEVDRPARAGSNDATYKNLRSAYETVAFGYDNTADIKNRPVSGMLTSFDPHQDLLKAYGNTQVVLKKAVLERSTVTPDDSLNGFFMPQSVKSFLDKPMAYSNSSVAAEVLANGKGYYTNRKRGNLNVPEIQIHGGVKTDDIDKVVFRDRVPAALATKLDSLSIPYEVRTIGDVSSY